MSKEPLTGSSYSPMKKEGMEDPGPRCPKCQWGISRVVKAEDRVVEIMCINAACDYTVTAHAGGIIEDHKNLPSVRGFSDSQLRAKSLSNVQRDL